MFDIRREEGILDDKEKLEKSENELDLDSFSKPTVFPVKFGNTNVLTFPSLHHGSFSLWMTPDTLS